MEWTWPRGVFVKLMSSLLLFCVSFRFVPLPSTSRAESHRADGESQPPTDQRWLGALIDTSLHQSIFRQAFPRALCPYSISFLHFFLRTHLIILPLTPDSDLRSE